MERLQKLLGNRVIIIKNKTIHIGFDAKRYFHNHTGLGNYSRTIINELIKCFPEHKYNLFSSKNSVLENGVKLIAPEGNAKLWRTYGITKNSDFKKLDVYHGLSNELPLRSTSTKMIVTIHDLIFRRFPSYYSLPDRFIYDYKSRKSCELANKIISVSEFTKKEIIHYYDVPEEKIEVIYQDCDPQFHTIHEGGEQVLIKYKVDKPYLLCVGTIEERKNQLELIKAFEQADFSGDLIFIGKETKYLSKIKEYLKGKAINKRIKFIHNVNFSELPFFYNQARIFIYPSKIEGFGIPVIEALNQKVPTISTKRTVMEEAGGDAALYYESGNIRQLRNLIDKVLNDTVLANGMIEKGLLHVQKFRTENTLKQLINVYKGLI